MSNSFKILVDLFELNGNKPVKQAIDVTTLQHFIAEKNNQGGFEVQSQSVKILDQKQNSNF